MEIRKECSPFSRGHGWKYAKNAVHLHQHPVVLKYDFISTLTILQPTKSVKVEDNLPPEFTTLMPECRSCQCDISLSRFPLFFFSRRKWSRKKRTAIVEIITEFHRPEDFTSVHNTYAFVDSIEFFYTVFKSSQATGKRTLKISRWRNDCRPKVWWSVAT